MKMFKLLLLVLLASLAISCSQDTFEEQSIDDPNSRLAPGQFDNSHLGVYKGLFTTVDGLTRGSVIITLSRANEGLAQIILSSGEVIELKSPAVKLTVDNTVSNLRFSSMGLSSIDAFLNFSVEGNGTNPMVSNVSFDTKESNILIAKNLSRLPATPITGTYECTNCASQGIGFPSNGRTWNVMAIGTGNNQNFAVQISYGGVIYNTPAANSSQNGCADSAGYTTCDIAGTAQILGHSVSWNGTHTYDDSTTEACSSVSGNWSAPTYGPGVTGTFTSDTDCTESTPENDICVNALPIACGESVTGSTSNATMSDAPGACGTDLDTGSGVWYSFTSNSAQDITIDTFGSGFDTKLGVFSGTCGALVCVGGNDDSAGSTDSLVSFNASSGTTYYVYVTGFESESGPYNLNVACGAAPVFDLDLTCGEFLIDHGGPSDDYANDRSDTYTIDAGEGNNVSLTFSQFDIETNWDFMRIYDGNSVASSEITMVGTSTIYVNGADPTRIGFTGNGAGPNSLLGQTVTSTGRYLTVVFNTDSSQIGTGFFAPVTCVAGRLAGGNSLQQTSETFMPQPSPSVPKVIRTVVIKTDN